VARQRAEDPEGGAGPPAADRGAPRTFAGKADNPVSQILQNADIGWTAARGPIAATGAQDVLTLATPLTGTLNVTGSLTGKATGAVGDALGGLLGGNVAKQIGSINIKNINATTRNVFFDRRYAQNNFAPPWFPSTTLSSTGASNAQYVSSVQRLKWLNNTSYY